VRVALVARNAPCPCGSGRKHKLCCGTTRTQERARKEALEILGALAAIFPLLRPDSAAFELWADAHADAPLTPALVDDALSTLNGTERERIAHAHAREFPEVWAGLVADVGDETDAEYAVLAGAVVAAMHEERRLDPWLLESMGAEVAQDPAETLALCLDPCAFWNPVEAASVEAALASARDDDWESVLDAEAGRLRTPQHDRRLALLVGRVHDQLPVHGFRRASRAIKAACDSFERDETVRAGLAAMLLDDALGALHLLDSAAVA
jgi:hypothetical protein